MLLIRYGEEMVREPEVRSDARTSYMHARCTVGKKAMKLRRHGSYLRAQNTCAMFPVNMPLRHKTRTGTATAPRERVPSKTLGNADRMSTLKPGTMTNARHLERPLTLDFIRSIQFRAGVHGGPCRAPLKG